ncbi:hypothetical protein NS206_17145 [Microbacterium testaceum]|nr:hypothetical protein [Microbacterium testaceum]KTS55350.1 hypothetical protein NS206_17145 [Microbacterium testaceum]
MAAKLVFRAPLVGEEFLEGASDELLQGGDVSFGYFLASHHARDLDLEILYSDGAHVTDASLLACAHEVLVHAAVPVVLRVDETADAALGLASGAVEQSTQKVEVNSIAVALSAALVENVLHRQEGFFADQGLMAATVQFAFVADDAGVVRIPQHLGQATL